MDEVKVWTLKIKVEGGHGWTLMGVFSSKEKAFDRLEELNSHYNDILNWEISPHEIDR